MKQQNLRDLIWKARKQQDHIAAELGVSAGAVSRWFSGNSRLPAVQVRGLARVLGVSPNVVLAAAEYTHMEGARADVTPPILSGER